MDIKSKEERSRNMSAIRSGDTKPEMLVRRYLHSQGFRYGLHNHKLPGSPDIVLRKYKTIIFINGCFWHGHECCKYFRLPKSNIEFWQTKIERNRQRDIETIETLKAKGWRVITIWECELRNIAQRGETLIQLVKDIKGDLKSVVYTQEGRINIAAEPEAEYGRDSGNICKIALSIRRI